jgi:hypothetical protein
MLWHTHREERYIHTHTHTHTHTSEGNQGEMKKRAEEDFERRFGMLAEKREVG